MSDSDREEWSTGGSWSGWADQPVVDVVVAVGVIGVRRALEIIM